MHCWPPPNSSKVHLQTIVNTPSSLYIHQRRKPTPLLLHYCRSEVAYARARLIADLEKQLTDLEAKTKGGKNTEKYAALLETISGLKLETAHPPN